MGLRQLLTFALLVAPTLVSAALFPKDTVVKHIGPKEFRKVMKQNVRDVHSSDVEHSLTLR
jgi:protein disulfide-isomerase A6